MVVSTRNTLYSSSNGSPLVLDDETKRFLAETITGMVEGSLATMQRLAKIEFLKFSGDDVKGWVFRCDQFFLMEQTLEMDKYETTAREYEDAFDNLLSRVEVSEDHDVSLFMGGLPTKIEIGVRIAKNIRRCLLFNKFARSYIEMLLRRRIKALLLLTIQEHKCSGQLYSLVFSPEIKNEGGEFLEEDESLVDTGLMDLQAPLISLNALTSTTDFKTMRVIVVDGNKLVTNAECKEFKWQFGPTIFTTDVMILPLGGL
ncbi:hypothetical protein Tco_0487762 [Tanacetum coccineum]